MAPSTGDESAHRQREAVQSELQRRRAADDPDERDLVETVGEEQRRQRAALDEDPGADDDG